MSVEIELSFETHSEYERIHGMWKSASIKTLNEYIQRMMHEARQGIAQRAREFDGRGARLLKLYLELRIEKCLMIGTICEAYEEETK